MSKESKNGVAHVVTQKSFEDTVEKNEIVLLDFWADWCGPCKTFAPTFEKVAAQNPDVYFGKVDTEAEQELAGAFGIRSIPTLMAFRQGILLFENAGVVPEAALTDLIAQIKGLDMAEVHRKMEEHAKNHEHGPGCNHDHDHDHDHGDDDGHGHKH